MQLKFFIPTYPIFFIIIDNKNDKILKLINKYK